MNLDFTKNNGLIPAIIQDAETDKVLMLGYMNEEALAKTQAEGIVTFYSRSKSRLWTKGETSGNFLTLVSIAADCDEDTLLIKVNPKGVVCHRGTETCFESPLTPEGGIFSLPERDGQGEAFLFHLEKVIQEAKTNPREGSYTASLFAKGIHKIAQKVGEEAVEIVIEAMDNKDELFKNEGADLLYHFLVLVAAKGFTLKDIVAVLEERHRGK
jgi:phosphoribosyl-ATP pyrophosphohydrolase/phosphoribosyl-AMP cyclohydrolase